MVRRSPQPLATKHKILECTRQECHNWGNPMWNDYDNYRKSAYPQGSHSTATQDSSVSIARLRPLTHSRIARKQKAGGHCHSMSLVRDVIAWVGLLRYQHHRSVPEIHEQLQQRYGWHQSTHSEQSISSLR